MGIRFPLTTVLDYNDSGNVGATSVVSQTFKIPQDADNIIVKIPVTSINGTNPVAAVYVQTTDDGGTTWYDMARLPDVTQTAVTNANALFASIPVNGYGVRTTLGPQVSVLGGGNGSSILSITGNASMRSLGAQCQSGLPVLGPLGRIQISYAGTIALNAGLQVQVKVNSDSSTS